MHILSKVTDLPEDLFPKTTFKPLDAKKPFGKTSNKSFPPSFDNATLFLSFKAYLSELKVIL